MDCAVYLEGVYDLRAVTTGPTPYLERAIDRKAQ